MGSISMLKDALRSSSPGPFWTFSKASLISPVAPANTLSPEKAYTYLPEAARTKPAASTVNIDFLTILPYIGFISIDTLSYFDYDTM